MAFKKGIHFSEEHKRKIGLANKGKHRSEQVKKEMSDRGKMRTGEKNAFYGKKHSEETKLKLSNKNKGKIPWQKQLGDNHPKVIEYKKQRAEQMSLRRKGKHPWNYNLTKEDKRVFENTKFFRENNPAKLEKTKLKISQANKGKLMGDLNPAKIEPNTLKITLGLKKAFKEGRKVPLSMEKNPMWKGGLSFEPYTTDWTNALRKFIRERDKFTCQLCGKIQEGKLLSVHHIDYNKKNCNPENLVTLCRKCHSKTNVNREKWIKYFLNKKV
jgi:hypothetical protein